MTVVTMVTMIMGVPGLQKTVTIVTVVTGKEKTMKKNVQISRELFLALIRYHLFDLRGDEERIRKELEEKMNALYRHELYETSKTAATSAEREKARQTYLDEKGVSEDFRW